MNTPYQVTPYGYDRDQEVLSLLSKVSDTWIDGQRYFNWKYRADKPDQGDFPNAWVVEHQGRIVAFNGYMLRRIKTKDAYYMGAQSFDTATDPEYRGQGLFGILQQGVYEQMRNHGIAWVYGWTSEIGFKVFTKKCGWSVWSQQTNLIKILDPKTYVASRLQNPVLQAAAGNALALYGLLKKPASTSKIAVQHVSSFPESIDTLCSQAIDSFDLIAARSSSYLNWRISNPQKNFFVLLAEKEDGYSGYLVYSLTQDAMDIEDCLVSDSQSLTALLAEAEKIGRESSKISIRFRVNQDHPWQGTFKKAGYFWSKTHFPMLGLQLLQDTGLELSTPNKHWTALDRNE